MMNILESVGRTTVNVMLLGVLCLVVEQAIYCVLIPGYFFSLMLSPVFWGSVSGICFFALWKMKSSDGDTTTANETEDEFFHFMYENPMSFANPNNTLPRNLGGWWD